MAKSEKEELSLSNEDTEDDSLDSEETTFSPPDGGWGWVVVFSSFMIHVLADGVTYTFGIFYVEFLKYFHENKGVTAWVASIMVGVSFTVGPIASALTKKYGCRVVTIAGSILASFGLFISIFSPNITYLYFTIGICTGTGIGLMYLPAIVCVTFYFDKKRAFATGIAVCGSGFGTFALAPLTDWLVDYYGWKGAMMIVSGILLNGIVFGALYRPLQVSKPSKKSHTEIHISQSKPKKLCNEAKVETYNKRANTFCLKERHVMNVDNTTLKPFQSYPDLLFGNNFHLKRDFAANRRNSTLSVVDSSSPDNGNPHHHRHKEILYHKDTFYSASLVNFPELQSSPVAHTTSIISISKEFHQEKERKILRYFHCSKEMRDALHEMVDFCLLKDIVFLLFGLSNFFTSIGFNVPYLYIKARAMEMGIAEDENASFLLSVIGITNTASRVIFGYLSDKNWMNRLWLYSYSLIICGISTASSSLCNTYILMAVYAATFGATTGAYISLTSVILVDLLGLDTMTSTFGLLLVFIGVACLLGPPITGWLYDATGSYDPGFYVSGAVIAISGMMMFCLPYVQRLQSHSTKSSGQVQRFQEVPTAV
ncbi:monocarboxylate transporter 12-like [Limulus polyphemus]|uniref:Monocarboxylate transporter 12-like n=1 Tax=Limulus polyphemus TaxID=6850 RepID=A0ABM1BC90_LIMPO|nr:monocarboxylate transporter 12-like [Limulus polyphemus]